MPSVFMLNAIILNVMSPSLKAFLRVSKFLLLAQLCPEQKRRRNEDKKIANAGSCNQRFEKFAAVNYASAEISCSVRRNLRQTLCLLLR